VGFGKVGLEPDRLPESGGGFVELSRVPQALPRLLCASTKSGLSLMASR